MDDTDARLDIIIGVTWIRTPGTACGQKCQSAPRIHSDTAIMQVCNGLIQI